MRLRELIGQGTAVRLVRRLIRRQRLPAALALIGQPGCGRRTMAFAIAQALLCTQNDDGDACGFCAACTLVRNGSHPDLMALPHDTDPAQDGDGNLMQMLPMARITALVEAVYVSPLMGERRIFIIPVAERLAASAHQAGANRMLKALEEPPPGVTIILTAASVSGLLPTIRSRVQAVRLSPLSMDDVEAVLVARGESLGTARVAARLSQGSHRHLDLGNDEAAPVAELLTLMSEGYNGALLADVVAKLPDKLSPAERAAERTVAAVQRARLQSWIAEARAAVRQRLRSGDAAAHGALLMLDKLSQADRDLRVNFNVRLVLDALALPTLPLAR